MGGDSLARARSGRYARDAAFTLMARDCRMSPARKLVATALTVMGCLDLCALAAAILPLRWIAGAHLAVGLGPFPTEPIAEYLARTGSLMYALHGATIVYVARDVDRYWNLIRFLAICALIHGVLILGIDSQLALPAWWKLLEGPAFSATGAIVLFLQWRAERELEVKKRPQRHEDTKRFG